MADALDLAMEIVRGEMREAEERIRERMEMHETAINVHTSELAELKAMHAPEESAESSGDDDDSADESAPAEGSPAAIEDDALEADNKAEDIPADVVEAITEINDRIAETHEEEIRPERMHWLHRPVFKKKD